MRGWLTVVFWGSIPSLHYWPHEMAWPNQISVFKRCKPVVDARLLWSAYDPFRLYSASLVINNAYPFKERLLYIIQNVFKTILWLNENLMQHIECYTERLRHRCLTKNFSHFHSSSTSCSQMVGQGYFASQSNFLVWVIFPSLMEGQLLIKYLY